MIQSRSNFSEIDLLIDVCVLVLNPNLTVMCYRHIVETLFGV